MKLKRNKYLVVSAINRNGKTLLVTTEYKAICKLHAKIRFKKKHKTTYVGCIKVIDYGCSK